MCIRFSESREQALVSAHVQPDKKDLLGAPGKVRPEDSLTPQTLLL